MYASLETVDIELAAENGVRRFIQTDHRSAEEIAGEREISVLLALLRVSMPRRAINPPPLVVYQLATDPPDFLLGAVVSAGGRLRVGHEPPWRDLTETVDAASLPRPEALFDEAMRALAHRTARELGLPLNLVAVTRLETDLLSDPPSAGDPSRYWTSVLRLASLGAEASRAIKSGGRWSATTDRVGIFPFIFLTPIRDGEAKFNYLGKARKFVDAGAGDSVVAMVRMAEAM